MAGEVRVSLQALRDDFEAVLDGLSRSGDLVWVQAGKQRFLLVNEPEAVREVLVDRSGELAKPRSQAIDTGPARAGQVPELDVAALRRSVTAGLANRDGDAAAAAREAAATETAAWRDGAQLELMPALRRIASHTAVRGAFASRLDAADVERLDGVLRWLDDAPRVLPASRFSRHNLRRAQVEQHLAQVAVSLVANANRSRPSELDAVAVEPGIVGELLHGAVGPLVQIAAWLLVRLDDDAGEAARLRAEWPETRRTEAFVREVTRLHPTNPRITRVAVTDTEVAGEAVPANTRVVLNVNAISRDPRYYEEPERLLPERWLDGRPHKFAYLSFGLGGRRCLGETFALAALTALLPALCAGWRISFADVRLATAGRRQPAEGTRMTVSIC